MASLLDDFGQWLISDCGVKAVFVCQSYKRPKPRNVAPETYEERRVQVNEYLEALLEHSDSITFWKHKRIFHSPHSIFDGANIGAILPGYKETVKG